MNKIIVLLSILLIIQQATGQTEKDALVSLYGATGGNSWFSSSYRASISSIYEMYWNTNSNPNPCGTSDAQYFDAWFGVICNSAGKVTALMLANNNLVGTIPANFKDLVNLEKLFLFNNKLSGSLPDLSLMPKLTHLYIFGNSFTNVSNVRGATGLKKFFFEDNQVANDLSWLASGNLPALEELDGTNNKITATLPSTIANNLRNLKLGKNSISGTIPSGLLTHTRLIFIQLQNNKLSGAIPSVTLSNTINMVNFSYNLLSCSIPSWLENTFYTVDVRGHTFYCPIRTPSNVLIDKSSCVSVDVTAINPTSLDILSGTNKPIFISATNINYCLNGDIQCVFNYPAAKYPPENVIATVANSSGILCPAPAFKVGGPITVCIGQFGKAISSSCKILSAYYNCASYCAPNGFCDQVNNVCICKVGFKGPQCKEIDCGTCNEAKSGGVCDPVTGKCICNFGWLPPNCLFSNKTCNTTCLNGGQCDGYTGTCQCKLGYQGANCSQIFCPPCNPKGGVCENGVCKCSGNWTGPTCAVPTGNCSDPTCSDRGYCDKEFGICKCFPTFEGPICQYKSCPLNCSYSVPPVGSHGICNRTDGTCNCLANYIGVACSVLDLDCPNNCTFPNGRCNRHTGECVCSYPYQKPNCALAKCPQNCGGAAQGTCDTATGKCNCIYPWIPPSCLSPNATCKNNCSGIGICNKKTGICVCPTQNYNEDCSTRVCPGNCSGHGVCNQATGTCICDDLWTGLACDAMNIPCVDESCGFKGRCNYSSGECLCKFGYGGQNCTERVCVNNCTYPNGTCNQVNGTCDCKNGTTGVDCSLKDCVADCINNSTCNLLEGFCACKPGWTGETCALVRCPSDCSGNGQCSGGTCICSGRWTGESCNIEEADPVSIALIVVGIIIGCFLIIMGGFLIWRKLTIDRLTALKEEEEAMNEHPSGEDISASDSDD